MRSASQERVLLLVTKKFAQRVYLNSNIRSKLFGTPTAAGLLRSNGLLSFLTLNRELFALFYLKYFFNQTIE